MQRSDGVLHLRGLNGLRAFSALAVVVSHLRLAHPEFGLPATNSLQLAMYGVTVFFALSGFLITYLLLKEQDTTGTVDVGSFYVRRILRIWPLYYFYLAAAVLTLWMTSAFVPSGSLLYYVFLLANVPFILDRAPLLINHYWSLGVEEQFYLFWPLVMKKLKHPVRAISAFIVFFLGCKAVVGFIKWKYQIDGPYLFFSVNRFDCMAMGALGAILVYRNNERFLRFCHHGLVQAGTWLAFLAIALNHFQIHPLANHTLVSVLAVIAIVNVAFNAKSIVSLDYPVLNFFGRISFGIYVYHPLVIYAAAGIKKAVLGDMALEPYQVVFLYGSVIGTTTAVSYFSFEYFERRFLKAKSKYTVVHSSPSKAA